MYVSDSKRHTEGTASRNQCALQSLSVLAISPSRFLHRLWQANTSTSCLEAGATSARERKSATTSCERPLVLSLSFSLSLPLLSPPSLFSPSHCLFSFRLLSLSPPDDDAGTQECRGMWVRAYTAHTCTHARALSSRCKLALTASLQRRACYVTRVRGV